MVWPLDGSAVSLSTLIIGGNSRYGNGIATVKGVMQVVGGGFAMQHGGNGAGGKQDQNQRIAFSRSPSADRSRSAVGSGGERRGNRLEACSTALLGVIV